MTLKVHFKPTDIVQLADVKNASRSIRPYVHRTPVLTCQTLDRIVGHNLFFKCENLQKTGAFKFRGAVNAVSQLSEAELAKGVVTHSSGNHAAALARAAQIFGTKAHIVMPSSASTIKRKAVIEYGGRVIECEPNLESRLEYAERVQSETGATMIPPFNDVRIIAGQGTAALEFLQQVPNLDLMVAPIGGGGLISGTCVTTAATSLRCKVIGAEPEGADDAFRSKEALKLLPQTNPQTISDGLLTSMGKLTWPYVRDVVRQVVTVSDEETVSAMKLFLERTKVLMEPSSAVALAAVISPKLMDVGQDRNIGIIISGGNVDLDNLPW